MTLTEKLAAITRSIQEMDYEMQEIDPEELPEYQKAKDKLVQEKKGLFQKGKNK